MKTIEEIIKREWQFFDKVQHIDGRASCQNNWENFEMFRTAQFETFDKETLDSYLSDLLQYEKLQYNPIMLKYAYMMETGDKEYFDKIKNNLPKIDTKNAELIAQIVEIELGMREEFNEQYPKISAQLRNTHTESDDKYSASFETYLRAELGTYSPKTLYLYAKMILEYVKSGKNIVTIIQENTVKMLGYKSLDDAEEKC